MQRWYTAVLVISSKVSGQTSVAPLLDVQYRVVRAASAEEAYQRALTLGRQEAHSYANADGETVTWEFLGLNDLCEVDNVELVDGTEVYSRLVREDPGPHVVAKERLTVFWAESNKHKTAAEILDE